MSENPFEYQGRIGINVEKTEYTIKPTGYATITVNLHNQGLEYDRFMLSVDGVPAGWVSSSLPVVELAPGEGKEIELILRVPSLAEVETGEHPFSIRVSSQKYPEQSAGKECMLTIVANVQFKSELHPTTLEAGQNAQVNVTNEGNVKDAFNISWQSEEDILTFELWQRQGEEAVFEEVREHGLVVEPGEQRTAHFRAGLRQRPFLGRSTAYPFKVQVHSSEGEVVTQNGEVKDKARIPLWVLPVGLVLCLALVFFAFLFSKYRTDQLPPGAQDDSWQRVQVAGVLRVATSADYPPFSYYNPDFVIDGFDPTLIREIGSMLGVQVQITDYAFEGLGATLQVGQADVVIAALSVTPERENIIDFSNIYYIGEDGILAQAGSDVGDIANIGQLAGKKIGVQKLSVYENWAQETLVNNGIISQDMLFPYAKPEHAVNDLKMGRLDLVVMDLQPAIHTLSDPDLKLVGQGLDQQRFAIAIPQGANALKAQIDQALLTLQNEGRVDQLAQIYLGLRPEDIIPPPTPVPTPESTPEPTQEPTPEPCIDAMELVEDLNYDDEDLTNFPKVYPGEAFKKGWRIKNSGTCAWNSSYFIKYVRGSDPAAQMGGQPTAIKGVVGPGQTYDMYVDLVAPEVAGKYVGYWQMNNATNTPFGQTIWVAIRVRKTEPAPPTATSPIEPTQPAPTVTVPPEPTTTKVPSEPTEQPGSDLLDTTWVVHGYLAHIEDDDLTGPIPGANLDLIFNEDGNFNGNAGCNTYSGRYVTDGIQIIFKDFLVTRLTCEQPEGIMEQEVRFINLLERAEEYRLNQDERLEIIIYVIENNELVEKLILLFYDLRVGPR